MGESWSRPFIKERFHEMARVSANCTTFLKTRGYNELSLRTLDAERVENAGPARGVAHVPSTIDGGDRSSSSNGVGGGGHSMRHVESLLTQLISEVRGLRSDWVSGKIPTPPATGAAGGEVTHSAGSDGGSGGVGGLGLGYWLLSNARALSSASSSFISATTSAVVLLVAKVSSVETSPPLPSSPLVDSPLKPEIALGSPPGAIWALGIRRVLLTLPLNDSLSSTV